MNFEVYTCFLDYREAFDRVQHKKLVEILRPIDVDKDDWRITTELCWHQSAQLRAESSISYEMAITKDVQQECILSSLLFSLYPEKVCPESNSEAFFTMKILFMSHAPDLILKIRMLRC